MRIARVETFLVAPRWLFCRVETDSGIVGWGEPVIEGRAEVVRVAVDTLAELLIGEDPLRIEHHWQVLTKGGFYRGGPILSSAVAGLDQALWDIAGKARGVPVHELLGGPVRDRARAYSWVGGDEPGEISDAVTEQVEAGLTAIKMNASGRWPRMATSSYIDAVLSRVATARELLGPDRDLAIDFHGRLSPASARRLLPLLEQFRPLFVEEPVLPEHAHALGDLVRSSPVPIAVGERLFQVSEFKVPLDAGVAVVQPDLSHAGGISAGRRIAALADVYGVDLAPHCPLGPIALAASLQLAFCTSNFLIQEQGLGIHYNRGADLLDYLVDASVFDYADGHIARLTGPGLGIEVDEMQVRSASAKGHAWRSPVWTHEDGSFAEW